MGAGLDAAGLRKLDEVMTGHAGADRVPGLAWAVARHGEVHVGAAGSLDLDGTRPVTTDSIFRLSSTTKPIAAAGALVLVDDGVIGLDDPVDDLLPELADRRVIVRQDAPIGDTVPADRPITVRDVLSFRLGWGMDFAAFGQPSTVLDAMGELGLPTGPPAPAFHLPPDEWLARLGTLPLQHQPGERWLYHLGAEVLGVLVARAAGTSLGEHLRVRVFEPLGMVDTGFSVPASSIDRFGPCFWAAGVPMPPSTVSAGEAGGGGGDRVQVYDPTDGQWAAPPPFEDGGAGLVSTVRDLVAFATMLLGRGEAGGERVLSEASVAAMTSDQLGEVRAAGGPDADGIRTWGLGIGVQVAPEPGGLGAGSFGWDGGLGSSWAADPGSGLAGVLLTDMAWTSPEPPAVRHEFWAAVSELA